MGKRTRRNKPHQFSELPAFHETMQKLVTAPKANKATTKGAKKSARPKTKR